MKIFCQIAQSFQFGTNSMKCLQHPKYKGIRKPTTKLNCLCHHIYLRNTTSAKGYLILSGEIDESAIANIRLQFEASINKKVKE